VLRRLCNYFEAVGSRRPGGDHGVLCFFICAACVVCCVVHEVFFYVCCLCCLLCCAARSDSWLNFLSTSLELGCGTVGLMGLKHISYVGFSIENKMADLNICTYLGFSIKNKIGMSDGDRRKAHLPPSQLVAL
jgi:hypothetical protein